MKVIILSTMLFATAIASAQSSSTHYRSNTRGMMLHGNNGQSTNAKNAVVNLWTQGHKQGSSYAGNQSGGIFAPRQDTTVKSIFSLSDANVFISPNPFQNRLLIQVDGHVSALEIEIVDVQGLVLQHLMKKGNSAQLSTSFIPKGLYLLRIKSEGSIVIRKMVKH